MIVKFWPIVGDQLRDEVVESETVVPVDGVPEPTTTPGERLERWDQLGEHIDWWADVPAWQDEVKATFQRWERRPGVRRALGRDAGLESGRFPPDLR